MKPVFTLLLLSFGILSAKPTTDTIDVWHVYYNKTKIKEFTGFTKGKIVLKAKQSKPADKLTVRYFSDTPCDDCDIVVAIEAPNKKLQLRAKGERTPILIDVKQLIELAKTTKVPVKVYRTEIVNRKDYGKQLLFEIVLI